MRVLCVRGGGGTGSRHGRKGIIEVSTMQWYQPAGDERRGEEGRGKKCRELVWLRWQERQKTCTHSVAQVQLDGYGSHVPQGQSDVRPSLRWPPGQDLSVMSQPQLSTWVQPASAVGARHARATARKRRGCEAKENW